MVLDFSSVVLWLDLCDLHLYALEYFKNIEKDEHVRQINYIDM